MPKNADVPPMSVLVVEDESIIRMIAVDMLEEAGFLVHEAASADEALKALEHGLAIGVLFTDINMPGSIDGLKLAELVAERWPAIRLVVTSGRFRLRNEEVPDDGHFLAKPYAQAHLLQAIAGAT